MEENKPTDKLKVAFFGTPDFSVPTLEILFNHPDIILSYVISMPDRPVGRKQLLHTPPVAQFAKDHNIPLIQTSNINTDLEAKEKLLHSKLDFNLVLAFAQFLKEDILDMPVLGSFNIHTSILPKYRGAAPIQYALLNGDSTTGVSIQKMVLKMDAGNLVHFKEIGISENETGGLLFTRLKFLAALETNKFINKLKMDQLTPEPQIKKGEKESDMVSFAPTLKKENGFLDFENSSFDQLYNQIRALDPWPGTFCYLGNKRLKVFEIEKCPVKLSPGVTHLELKSLLVGCLDSTIRLTSVQIEGKKPSTDTDLLNGLSKKLEQIIINP